MKLMEGGLDDLPDHRRGGVEGNGVRGQGQKGEEDGWTIV
jgi:hypothetical protein